MNAPLSPPSSVSRPEWPYRLAAHTALSIMHAQRWRFDAAGVEHLPEQGGAVIAANHTSFWDFFAVGRHPFLTLDRPLRILAKDSIFRLPVVGAIMRKSGHIPVRRGAGRSALHQAIGALRRGELVLVMPEQTISPAFELLDLRPGAARMAQAAEVPLIPAVSWGTHRFHTVGRLPRPQWSLPVSVRYGAPILHDPTDTSGQVTQRLAGALRTLLDDVQEKYPDGAPRGAWWVPARLGGGAPTPQQAEAYLANLARGWAIRTPRTRR